jgi:hypothetical protein
MARNVDRIAHGLGAKVIAQIPDVGAGAFGAARLAQVIEQLRSRLTPAQGLRTGRPTNARWERRPKVPMSEETEQRLIRLATEASTTGRKISPMQLAAQILEEALAGLPEDNRC